MLETATGREQQDLELLRRVHRNGDEWAREELARRFMPLVHSIARRYRAHGEPIEDIVQAGSVGLVKAIDRFDIDAGTRFVAFAAPNIQGEIRRHFRDHTWAVHVPRSLQELNQRVRHLQHEAIRQTGREASVTELAAQLGEATDAVAEAVAVGDAYETLSLDQPAQPGERPIEYTGQYDRGYNECEDRAMVRDAWDALDGRTKRIVWQRFFEDRLQREIADDIGVSQMQISRLISNGLRQMRDHLDGRPVAPAG